MTVPASNSNFSSSNRLIFKELSYNRSELKIEHDLLFAKLNDKQRYVYNMISQFVLSGSGVVFFVYRYGGTGKTFLWKTL
ncbi:hypothetical protein ACS0TY_014323 [Phlomoides rotata]